MNEMSQFMHQSSKIITSTSDYVRSVLMNIESKRIIELIDSFQTIRFPELLPDLFFRVAYKYLYSSSKCMSYESILNEPLFVFDNSVFHQSKIYKSISADVLFGLTNSIQTLMYFLLDFKDIQFIT